MQPLGKISGLGPAMSRIREGMAQLREDHDGLSADLTAYGAAVNMVRDHVRSLHEDLSFEVSDRGNGGGQVSQERVEQHLDAMLGTEDIGGGEAASAAPLADGPAAADGGASHDEH